MDVGSKLDKAPEGSTRMFKTLMENQENLNRVVDLATFLSPFLIYRGLLKTYVSVIDPIIENPVRTHAEHLKILERRKKTVTYFNVFIIPVILGIGYFKYHSSKELNINVNISNNDNNNTSSFHFLGLGFLEKKLYLVIPAVILFFKFWCLPFIKNSYPSLYKKIIIFADLSVNYVPILLLSWVLLLTLFHLIQSYVYLIFCSKNEKVQPNKYLPKFINNYLINLYNISQSEEKQAYMIMFNRTMLFHVFMSILGLILYYVYI